MAGEVVPRIALGSPAARYVTALGDRLRALGPDATLDQWLDVPPIVVDIDDRVGPQTVEEAFDKDSGALRTVCFKPYARLRTIEEVQPTSKVRKVTNSSISRLAAHPEDWSARSPLGVRPSRLLARRADENLEVYENQVAVGTLAALRRHFQRRLADLRSLTILVQDVVDLQAPAAQSAWTVHQRMWRLLRNLGDMSHKQTAVQARVAALEEALRSVELMFASPLGRAVAVRSDLPIALHPSNLLADNHQYRRVAALWEVCAATSPTSLSDEEAELRWSALVDAFQRYVMLLVVQACVLVHAVPEEEQPAPVPGEEVRFVLHGKPLTVGWGLDGVLTVEWGTVEVLQIRALLDDLEKAREPAVIRARTVWPNDKDGHSRPGGSLRLTVYAGLRAERDACGDAAYDALYRITSYEPAVAPVSPLELASVSRVVRALRWAVLARQMTSYPALVPVNDAEREALRDCGWLADLPAERAVAATRPPTGREMTLTRQVISGLVQRTDRARGLGGNADRIAELMAAVEAAADEVGRLTICPVCNRGPQRSVPDFEDRGDGLFADKCSSCETRWELRRCRKCSTRYPVLLPIGELGRGSRQDEVDRIHGGDVLAIGCRTLDGSGQAICPSCGVCGGSAKLASCPRPGCAGRAAA